MMGGLFVVFDPVSVMGLHLNWVSMLMGLMMFPFLFWLSPSRYSKVWDLVASGLLKEVSSLFTSKVEGVGLLFCSVFWFIVMNNILGLFPYIFTATSHILVTITLAMFFWLSLMMFGWVNSTLHMLAHLVPLGTPMMLMGFMVVIESVSSLIRPITLSVRLAANMIAGHLLIVLLGSIISFKMMILFGSFVSMCLLLLLELAVACIQSYVFMILVGLYFAEI